MTMEVTYCNRHNEPAPYWLGKRCLRPHLDEDPNAERCEHGYLAECSSGCREREREDAGHERSSVTDTGGEERGTGLIDGLFLNVGALLDGGLPDPPSPVLLHRTDGHAIFYARQVNMIFGDPESGKTLVAQAAASEALKKDRRVLFVDIDHNGPQAIVSRFLDMEVPEDTLRDPALFRYVEPEDKSHLMAIIKNAKQWRPAVAVVDSVGELLPMLGLNSNLPDDFTLAHTAVLKPLALSGASVLAIDHLSKNGESRASGPTGTAAKKRAVGGTSIRVTISEPFTPGKGGAAVLTIHKDRHGGLRRHCPVDGKEPSAGVFRILPGDDRISWTVNAPTASDASVISGVDQADIDALDKLDPSPTSVRDVRTRMRWSNQRAMDVLREWRSRSRVTPEEQVTPGTDLVTRNSTPYVSNEERSCRVCAGTLDPFITASGTTTHPNCEETP